MSSILAAVRIPVTSERIRRFGSAGLAVVLASGGVVAALQRDGFSADQVQAGIGAVWVASSGPGQLALLDGASASVVVKVVVAQPGDELTAVQGDGAGFALNRSSGSVVRVDAATWDVSDAVGMIPDTTSGLAGATAGDALFVLDRDRGLALEVDARSLASRGGVTSLSASPGPGSPVVDSAGAMWLLDDVSGDLVRINDQRVDVVESAVADAGAGRLVLVGGAPVVVDPSDGSAVAFDAGSGERSREACVDNDRSDSTVQVAGSTGTPEVFTVSGADGVLRIAELSTGRCAGAVSGVASPGSELGVPTELSRRLFVPNYTTGAVAVVDLDRQQVIAITPPIVEVGAEFDLLSQDGFVFYNDPASERAGVISLDGKVSPIVKYDVDEPGKGVHQPNDLGTQPSTAPTPSPQPSPSRTPTATPKESPDVAPTGPGPEAPGDPDVRILADDGDIEVGESVSLWTEATDGTDPITMATWNFADGTSGATGVRTRHSWTAAGEYAVQARATHRSGRTESVTTTVGVSEPTAGDAKLVVEVDGPGAVSSPAGINCDQSTSPCEADLDEGFRLVLTANPVGVNARFDGWGGACSGSTPRCEVTVNESVQAVAHFSSSEFSLNVIALGGLITSSPGTIECTPWGDLCSDYFPSGTSVTLIPVDSRDYHFIDWSGDCSGSDECVLDMTSTKNVRGFFRWSKAYLTVTVAGEGLVTSDPAGISCAVDSDPGCLAPFYRKTIVDLTAEARPGWEFEKWEGDCNGTQMACSVSMENEKYVDAVFKQVLDEYALTIDPPTFGRITGDGIECPGDCNQVYPSGTVVPLSADADAGYHLDRWDGDCAQLECTVTMDGNRSVGAIFVPNRYPLDASATAGGLVTAPGIRCQEGAAPADCTEDYDAGTRVTVSYEEFDGFSFNGWGGACSGTGDCTVTMNSGLNVSASFVPLHATLDVHVVGAGSVSWPGGSSCPPDCLTSFERGTSVTLSAEGDLLHWGDGCSGSSPTCTVVMDADKSVSATFEQYTEPPPECTPKNCPGPNSIQEINSASAPPVLLEDERAHDFPLFSWPIVFLARRRTAAAG